jgi:predicted double-glycine peptidase
MTRQATDYTCGAAALQSVIGYYGENVREGQLAKELRSNSKQGTNYQRMVAYAKQHGYDVAVKTDTSIDELKKMLDAGKPVIVLLQAWPEREVDYPNDWDDGHYVVAIGHDADNIYFMDPCTLGNYAYVPTAEFLTRWHDRTTGEKLVHFTMQVTKPTPGFDPNVIQKMD